MFFILSRHHPLYNSSNLFLIIVIFHWVVLVVVCVFQTSVISSTVKCKYGSNDIRSLYFKSVIGSDESFTICRSTGNVISFFLLNLLRLTWLNCPSKLVKYRVRQWSGKTQSTQFFSRNNFYYQNIFYRFELSMPLFYFF